MLIRPFSPRYYEDDAIDEKNVLKYSREFHVTDLSPLQDGNRMYANVIQTNTILVKGVPADGNTLSIIEDPKSRHTLTKNVYHYEACFPYIDDKIDYVNGTYSLKLIVVSGVTDTHYSMNPQVEDEVRFLVSMFKPSSSGGQGMLSNLYNSRRSMFTDQSLQFSHIQYHHTLMLDIPDPRYHVVRIIEKDSSGRFNNARKIPLMYKGHELLSRPHTTINLHNDKAVPTAGDTARSWHTNGGIMSRDDFGSLLDKQLSIEALLVNMTKSALNVICNSCVLAYNTKTGQFNLNKLTLPVSSLIANHEIPLVALELEFTKQCEKLSEKFNDNLYIMMHISDTEHRARVVFLNEKRRGLNNSVITVRIPRYECINDFIYARHNISANTIHNFINDHDLKEAELSHYTTIGELGNNLTQFFN